MSLSLQKPESLLRGAILKFISPRNVLNFRRNEVIYSQGDLADALFYIQSGRVKLAVVSQSGKEATLSVFAETDLLGLGCLSFQEQRLGTATAMESSQLIRIDRESWFKLLREQPELFEVALAHLSSRNIELQKDLCAQILQPSETRLARILLKLAQIGVGQSTPATLPRISHDTLASMVGTTRSRITFFMNSFKKRGLIDYKGSVMVDPSRLTAALQDE